MIPTFYQIKLGNTTAYARSHANAVQFQNELYQRTKKTAAQIKPIKKSQIPIQDWDLVNELNDNKVQISLRYL